MCGGGEIFLFCRLNKYAVEQQSKFENINSEISGLGDEIENLQRKLKSSEVVSWDEKGYNYLAIGNSITIRDFASYWWDDDRGMASSCDEKDYVHRVKSYLEDNNEAVTMYAVNFATWEIAGTDRAEFLTMLDNYLDSCISLITVQLGENAQNLETFELDYEELISYIKQKAPNAEIVIVGDFWTYENRDELKNQAATRCGVEYVSLDGIKDNSSYYAGIGTEVEDSEGNKHSIEHDGVAVHPGDAGMEAIAERIIKKIKI